MSSKIVKAAGVIAAPFTGGTSLAVTAGLTAAGEAAKLLSKKKSKSTLGSSPQVMPLPDDEKVKLARKRSLAQQMARGGRAATILTDTSDTLG